MKLYEVKALAHETQSRIRQDLNAWNDFLEHASRVYRYRFMDQILIYAQRPDAVACATMNIWNSKMGCWIKKGNRGITFATGTPISNSMTELYTNMRYLQAGRLKELGFENFDAWASTFGETQTAIELAPEGYTLVGR